MAIPGSVNKATSNKPQATSDGDVPLTVIMGNAWSDILKTGLVASSLWLVAFRLWTPVSPPHVP